MEILPPPHKVGDTVRIMHKLVDILLYVSFEILVVYRPRSHNGQAKFNLCLWCFSIDTKNWFVPYGDPVRLCNP